MKVLVAAGDRCTEYRDGQRVPTCCCYYYLYFAASLTGFSQQLMKHGVNAVVIEDFGHVDAQRLGKEASRNWTGRRGSSARFRHCRPPGALGTFRRLNERQIIHKACRRVSNECSPLRKKFGKKSPFSHGSSRSLRRNNGHRSKDPWHGTMHRPRVSPYPGHVDRFTHEVGASPVQGAQRPMPAAGTHSVRMTGRRGCSIPSQPRPPQKQRESTRKR